MELEYLLRWIVGANVVFGLVRTLRHLRTQAPGWLGVHVLVLLVVGAGSAAAWAATGYLAAALWVLLVLGPQLLTRQMLRALHHHRLGRAARYARAIALLHPFDGLREQAQLLGYQAHVGHGRWEAARTALEPLLSSPAWAERARLEQLRLSDDWTGIARHVGTQAPGTRSLRIAPLYLRALGETGDLEQMWRTYGMLPASLRALPLIRLQMAAYSGLSLGVERLLATELSSLAADQSAVWRATSYQRAGQPTLAHQELSSPAHGSTPTSRETERRREAPLSPARLGELSAEAQELVEQFKAQAEAPEPAQSVAEHRARLWATTTLAVVLAVVYLLGAPGGSRDLDNLVRWGALVVPLHLLGDHAAWRVVTAGLLHFGATHLAVNVLGLWLLGREAERLYGGRVLLAIFAGANVGAFALAAFLVDAAAEAPRVMLGASAGVMGLVGALFAFAVVGYLRAGHRWLGRQIVLLLAVVATQVLFDVSTPEVSSFLHLTGLGIGAAIGFAFSWSTFTRRSHA